MYLKEISNGRKNNLDLIRFVAAIMVIFSHSFPVSLGANVWDPLAKLTNDQISFGSLAVGIFFVYGGFLICKSMHRLQTGKAYFKARFIRIFPALITVVTVSAFLMGPILTSLSVRKYFGDFDTYKYLLNGILVLQHNLPGVFENNIYANVVNGPLWTLPVEFLCYVMCFVFYKINLLERKNIKYTIGLFFCGCVCVKILSVRLPMLETMIRPVGLFFVGMLGFIFRDKIKISLRGCVITILFVIISLMLGIFSYTIFVLLPYILFYFGYATKTKYEHFAKHGEISYGVYLCAWPIQQIVCEKFGGTMNPFLNFIFATVLAILGGWILYKIIEEPLNKYFKRTK